MGIHGYGACNLRTDDDDDEHDASNKEEYERGFERTRMRSKLSFFFFP